MAEGSSESDYDDKDGGQNEDNADDNDGVHWVEKLFPPAFSVNDLIDSIQENRRRQDPTFEQLARRILPEDIESIKNVYHKVWLMMRDARKTEETSADSDPQTPLDDKKSPDKSLSQPQPDSAASNTCIWNSNEINVLRGVFKETKEENIELRSKLAVLNDELSKTNKRERETTQESAARNSELLEAVKANRRLEILVNFLKKELKKSRTTVKVLNERTANVEKVNERMNKDIVRLHKELDVERLERKSIDSQRERELDEIKSEWRLREQKLVEDSDRAQTEMLEEMRKLRAELDEEREKSRRTVRGLNHLQMHFASLPLAEENVRKPHELNTFTCQ